MNLGTAFIVTIPNRESSKRLRALLARRIGNYPIICCPVYYLLPMIREGKTEIGIPDMLIYPQDWLVSSIDGYLLSLKSGQEANGLGLIIREATQKDLHHYIRSIF